MAQSKIEWKVGLFVVIGLVLLAALMLNFSKGMALFKKTYKLQMVADNAGGIKEKAMVLMSGIKVGNVIDANLSTNGKVIIRLQIDSAFKIDQRARFLVDAMGFLGDQYVAIVSTNSSGPYLADNAVVYCEPPLNLQEAMRSTASLLQQAQATMRTLDEAVSNVNRSILNPQTLTSFAQSISNIQAISGNANATLARIDKVVDANSPALHASISNLFEFSVELKTVLKTNQNDIAAAVKNLRTASVTVNELLDDVKATNGTVGLLLRDEQMKSQLVSLGTNLTVVAENFGAFSSNLNRRGIWSMLWKPKTKKESSEQDR
ncbi:MAG: MlaD family protein [Verrucomicrobiota bacterium]